MSSSIKATPDLTNPDPTSPSRPCSPQYLLVLAEDLLQIGRQLLLWSSANFSKALARRILRTVVQELWRIHQNPCLIPVEALRKAFWTMVVRMLAEFPTFEEFSKEDRQENFVQLTDQLISNRKQQLLHYRGTFDFRRPLWQQFLHNMSPGYGGIPPSMPPAMQDEAVIRLVIPPGGVEIMRKWETSIENARARIFPVQRTCRHGKEIADLQVGKSISWTHHCTPFCEPDANTGDPERKIFASADSGKVLLFFDQT